MSFQGLTALIVCFCAALPFTVSSQSIPQKDLRLWLKADAGVETQGDRVISWEDQSEQHIQAITTSKNPPRLIKEDGIPAISFNGKDNGMSTSATQTFPSKRGTIIVVSKVKAQSKTSSVGTGTLVSTYHGDGITWQLGLSFKRFSFYDGAGGEGFPALESTPLKWSIITLVRDTDTSMLVYLNGRKEVVINVQNNQPSVNEIKIGYNKTKIISDQVGEVFNGDIAEVIIYDVAVNAESIDAIHRYLSRKYNLKLTPPPFQETTWFYGLVVLLVAMFAFAISRVIVQRKLRKQLAELLLQKQIDGERQRISREMHDEIGAGLTQIVLMSESAKGKLTARSRELEEIVQTSRRLVGNMSEIIWSMNPENKSLSQLLGYLREQLNAQLEYSNIHYNIELPEGGDIVLTNEQRRNILLISREIVNNTIKHSQSTYLEVKAILQDGELQFEIKDNGIGFTLNDISFGNGLNNIRHRVRQLGGTLTLLSEPGKGCSFKWSVRLISTT